MIHKLMLRIKDFLTPEDVEIAGSKPKGEFVKGINFGGEAVKIEGMVWEAFESASAQGLFVQGASVLTTSMQPQPYAPPGIRTMLNSAIYKSQVLEIEQTLPNGEYEVYLWIMENYQKDWHSLEVKLAGEIVATDIGKLSVAQWARYGGYGTTITDGVLRLSLATHNPQVDAHIMGMSIYKV